MPTVHRADVRSRSAWYTSTASRSRAAFALNLGHDGPVAGLGGVAAVEGGGAATWKRVFAVSRVTLESAADSRRLRRAVVRSNKGRAPRAAVGSKQGATRGTGEARGCDQWEATRWAVVPVHWEATQVRAWCRVPLGGHPVRTCAVHWEATRCEAAAAAQSLQT
ncbi:unnamed protein product [Boreogadus saida]